MHSSPNRRHNFEVVAIFSEHILFFDEKWFEEWDPGWDEFLKLLQATFCFVPVVTMGLFLLLVHEVIELIHGISLHARQDVAIYIEGGADTFMAQDILDLLGINSGGGFNLHTAAQS